MANVGILSAGKCLPVQKILSKDLEKRLRLSARWILDRTGIEARHYVSGKENGTSLALKAAQNALAKTKCKNEELANILVCASLADQYFPPLACKLQRSLNAPKARCFDLSAGASGFGTALQLLRDRYRSQVYMPPALIVGVAVQSSYLNPEDANSAVVFGDGAGAVVLGHVPEDYGLIASQTYCRGESFDALQLNRQVKEQNSKDGCKFPTIQMDGMKVAREFLKYQPVVIEQTLAQAKLKISDVNFFIFHQANPRLLQTLMGRLKISADKTHMNAQCYGNTSEASALIALSEAMDLQKIKRDDWVLISLMGAGLIFETLLIRWY